MNKKIPCGGFYVGDGLNVDENGVLSAGGIKISIVKGTIENTDSTSSPVTLEKTFEEIQELFKTSIVCLYINEESFYVPNSFTADEIIFDCMWDDGGGIIYANIYMSSSPESPLYSYRRLSSEP